MKQIIAVLAIAVAICTINSCAKKEGDNGNNKEMPMKKPMKMMNE